MATLIAKAARTVFLATTLFAAFAFARTAQPRSRLLTETELGAVRALVPPSLSGAELVRTQSFGLEDGKWIVGYVLPPPGGKYRRGEIGFLVVRNGQLIEAPHVDSGSYAQAINAMTFADADHDGLLDVIMLVQIANSPGQVGFTDAWVLRALQGDRYAYDKALSFVASGTGTTPLKTMSDARANLRAAEKTEPPLLLPTHKYVMDGFLDSRKRKCTGKAVMEKEQDDAKSPCLVWTLTEVKCNGKGQADWVHNDPDDPEGASARICHKKDGWQYVDDLPGLGTCDVNQAKEPMPANISPLKANFALGCMWTCRKDSRSACDGGASYEFIPLTGAPSKRK